MAALCTGNYGLTQNCIDNSKEYYFVKLTDSALRAVEDYQKNQGKYNTNPTIRIEGNSGVISFPASGQNRQQFRFSIDDIEGSFQCIKQTQNQLEVQGSLPFKLRIHANDDVYETTKHRMAVAEENQKNKCTREIKPNQTDIGRKVKLKNRHTNIPPKRDPLLTSSSPALTSSLGTASSQSPLSSTLAICSPSASSFVSTNLNPASSTHQPQYTTGNTTTMSPLSTSSGTSGYSTSSISPLHSSSLKSSNCNNNLSNSSINSSSSSSKLHSSYHSNVTSASSLSSALSSAAGSGTSGITSSYYGSNNSRGSNGIGSATSLNSASSRRNVAGVGANLRNQRNGSRHTPDITKKKLRDRLIHLLALKPYKKPELYARLQNEGIRDREKASISVILKEISSIRDNTYNLKRQMWNDVNEDWPFYSEQEIQMLKRRKPQNLTPPISSDGGSSTSGQSPTSTHNGSPPPAVKRPSLDRDRYFDEPTTKKQRISHFRKDNNEINSSNLIKHPEPEDNAMSLSYGVLGSEAARRISPRDDISNLNGHSNSSTSMGHHHSIIPNSHHHINSHPNNNNNNINSNNKNTSSNSKANTSGINQSKSSPLYSSNTHSNNGNSRHIDSRQKVTRGSSSSSPMFAGTGIAGGDAMDNLNILGHRHQRISSPGSVTRTMTPLNDRSSLLDHNTDTLIGEKVGSHNNNSRISSINMSCGNSVKATSSSCLTNVASPSQNYDFSKFTSINSIEQRRKYKSEFERNYAEYRELLQIVEGVAKKFKMLALQLEENKNNPSVYREIRRKILSEYDKTNRDRDHQKIKARFDYLHAKLAHIKALVHDFDQTLTSSGGNESSGGPTQSPLQQSSDSLGNDHFSSMNCNMNRSPILSRRNGGSNTSSHRTLSSPVMNANSNMGCSSPELHHHLSESY